MLLCFDATLLRGFGGDKTEGCAGPREPRAFLLNTLKQEVFT